MIWHDDFTGGVLKGVEKGGDGFLRLAPSYFWGTIGSSGGQNAALVPAASHYETLSSYTVELWANRPTYAARYPGFFAKKPAYGSSLSTIEWYTNEYGITQIHNRISGTRYDYGVSYSAAGIPTNTWVFMALRMQAGSGGALIVNGSVHGTHDDPDAPTAGLQPLTLGQGYWNSLHSGALFFIRLWDHARSDAQIREDMWRIPKPDEEGLLGAWFLDEGVGNTVYDWSVWQNHGTNMVTSPRYNTGFKHFGVRVAELDFSAVGSAASSSIAWTSQEPAGTAVTIETNLSLDGGLTWQGWQTCTNGGEIPGITSGVNLSNARLKVWEHLHTELEGVEPVLESLTITVGEGGAVGHETFSDTVIKSYAERRTRSDIILTTAARRDTLSDIVLTTWPPHNTFSEVRLTRPVKRDTLCEVRVATKNFVQPEPSPGAIWRPIRPGTGVWTPVPPGEKQPWKEGAEK